VKEFASFFHYLNRNFGLSREYAKIVGISVRCLPCVIRVGFSLTMGSNDELPRIMGVV